MSRSARLSLLVPITLFACGPGAEPADPEVADPEVADPEVAVSAEALTPPVAIQPWASGGREVIPPALAAACPTNRWIGYILTAANAPCPAATNAGWSVAKLFGPASHATWAPDLDRFCLYTWNGLGAPPVAALPNTGRMRLEADCRVVVPLADPSTATSEKLASSWVDALSLPTFSAVAPPPTARVRVAIVDASPTETSSGLPSGTGHGLAVGAVARRAGSMSESGFGAPFITSHRALALSGGDFGYQGDVARALMQAIESFRSAGTEVRLVVNLSLGWDPQYGTAPGPGVRVASYAVYEALQVAACENVLVVAAAGNRARVDLGSGPLLPAGWEPSTRLCPTTVAYAPLVHAIGGLTGDDVPLALSRSAARPRLAAPASLVTTALPGGGGYSPLLSGTSMASAATAGVAALVWGFAPNKTPEQLMDTLYDHAVSLGVPADFEHAPWSWTAARLDACAAVTAVTTGASVPIGCATRTAGQAIPIDVATIVENEAPGLWAGPTTPGFTAALAVPGSQADDVTLVPWAGPQPSKPPCPLCVLSPAGSDALLTGALDLAEGSYIDSMFVRGCFGDCDPGDPTYEVLGNFVPGAWIKVLIPGLDTGSIDSARLETKVVVIATGESTAHAAELYVDF